VLAAEAAGTRPENLERFMEASGMAKFRTLFDDRCGHSAEGKKFAHALPQYRRANDLNIRSHSSG
jgi:hypothetical protein